MVANGFIRGHKVYYDDKSGFWYYSDGKRVYDNDCRECVKCGKPPIDDIDFCLYALHDCDFINSACCGHGVEEGYIMLKDGRRFILEQNSGDSDD